MSSWNSLYSWIILSGVRCTTFLGVMYWAMERSWTINCRVFISCSNLSGPWLVSTSPCSGTDKGHQCEKVRSVFVFQHGLLGWTLNFVAPLHSTPLDLPYLVDGRWQWLLSLLPPWGHIIWLVERSEEAECGDEVKPSDWQHPGFAIPISFQIFQSRHYKCEGNLNVYIALARLAHIVSQSDWNLVGLFMPAFASNLVILAHGYR